MGLTSFLFEYTASASNPSAPTCSFSCTCLLTQMYPFSPRMRSMPLGRAKKWDLSRRMSTGGTVTSWPFRSYERVVNECLRYTGRWHGRKESRDKRG